MKFTSNTYLIFFSAVNITPCIGMAFFFGVPLGGILSSKVGITTPLMVGIALCIFNVFAISVFLPESMDTQSLLLKSKIINVADANPLGAMKMFGRNSKFASNALVYFLLQLAQSGLQVTWINYLQHRFGWSGTKSGLTLMVVGIMVAVLPQYVIPLFGVKNSVLFGKN